MKTCVRCGRRASCSCAVVQREEGTVCKICIQGESLELDIKMELKKVVCHIGAGGAGESVYGDFVKRYADSIGAQVASFGLDTDFFKAADVIKRSHFCFIWNGLQGKSPLAARLCQRRGIPHVFFEFGMLPQSDNFFLDPNGFCGDSILNGSLSWVNHADRARLQMVRSEMQARYPLQNEGFVLVPLQIENDSQILYYSPYRSMNEVIEHIEAMYPRMERVIVRPHPKGGKKRPSVRAEVVYEGDFLDWARRASVVVGVTSTCLYEAGVLGVPTIALGDHPLRTHNPMRHDDVLAGALALNVGRSESPASVLERFNLGPI